MESGATRALPGDAPTGCAGSIRLVAALALLMQGGVARALPGMYQRGGLVRYGWGRCRRAERERRGRGLFLEIH